MLRHRSQVMLILSFVLLAFSSPVLADAAHPLKKTLRLDAHGGCQFKVPNWTISGPKKDHLAVLKTNKVKGPEGFYILMLTVEKAPTGKVVWEEVRKNVVAAATKGGASLLLTLGADWTETKGFTGKRMLGVLTAKGRKMIVQVISMVSEGRLVTVSLVSKQETSPANRLIGAIAKAISL